MAVTNGYCTLAEVKAAMRLSDSVDDTLIENSIEGASRRIDGYCGRFFYQTTQTVLFYGRDSYRLLVSDIATTTGLTITTDDRGDNTFSTSWTLNTDYIVEPTDAVLQNRPYRVIQAIGGKTWPLYVQPSRPAIKVIATYGYPSVPDDVREACVLLSMRQFARYNAALGVVGFADMAITVRAVDPDVRDLLTPYRILGAI